MIRRLWQEAAKRTKIPLTERDIERTLRALLASQDIWEVIDRSDVPMMALFSILEVLEDEGLLHVDGERLVLTAAGHKLAEDRRLAPARELRCPHCGGRGLDLGQEPLRQLLRRFDELSRGRPEAIQEYDQGYVTPETAVARVAMMWARGDLEGKRLVVLGDDDLVGLAAALTGAPREVLVVDIDPRIIEFTRQAGEREGLPLRAAVHDLREPLPREWLGAFDTFFTDPPETFAGLRAFIERGLLCLAGPGSAGYFGLTHREASLAKWRSLQRHLLELGACITELIDDFNEYVDWGYLEQMRAWGSLPVKVRPKRPWYRSSLYRIELLERPRLANEPLPEEILKDEEAATN